MNNWLQAYLERAVNRGLCTKMVCTTCGAMDFRNGAVKQFLGPNATKPLWQWEIGDKERIALDLSLVSVRTIEASQLPRFRSAVMCLLYDLCYPCVIPSVKKILDASYAGEILQQMEDHQALRLKRRDDEIQNSQARHENRMKEKRETQKQHELRKVERDKIWREQQAK